MTLKMKRQNVLEDFRYLENRFKEYNIRINYEKSHILAKTNGNYEKNIDKLIKLGYKKVDRAKLLGKIIHLDEDNYTIGGYNQMKDITFHNMYRFHKLGLRIQLRLNRAFIVGRILHLYLSSSIKESDTRDYFNKNIIKFIEKNYIYKVK